MKIQRILVPVDYSPCSKAAVALALDLAGPLQATLDIVHVWDRPSYVTNVLMTSTEPVHGKSLFALIEQHAERDLQEFLESAKTEAGPTLRGRLLTGDPAAAILHELGARPCDLVVVGTHGRTGLTHLLMGSVAEKLVRLSPVPVLTVPDQALGSRMQKTAPGSASST